MRKNGALAKSAAVIGTFLLWMPILATILFTAFGFAVDGGFRVDWLTPLEFFPVAMAGAALLLYASFRTLVRRKAVGWSAASMVGLLALGNMTASSTGLASGAVESGSGAWVFVTATMVGYVIALLALDALGVLVIRDLFGRTPKTATLSEVPAPVA